MDFEVHITNVNDEEARQLATQMDAVLGPWGAESVTYTWTHKGFYIKTDFAKDSSLTLSSPYITVFGFPADCVFNDKHQYIGHNVARRQLLEALKKATGLPVRLL